jgi:hypothetical protein
MRGAPSKNGGPSNLTPFNSPKYEKNQSFASFYAKAGFIKDSLAYETNDSSDALYVPAGLS